jgi:hypothetical protein
MPTNTYAACIEACNACASACNHCAVSCLQERDVQHMARCVALDMECVAACQFAAGAMAREGDFVIVTCLLCADICDACAKECRRHDAEHCQACAKACGLCADACRALSV